MKPSKYNLSCSWKKGIWITRLRLGLSPLNYHRYTYHLINEPFCEFCPQTNESTEHFLFKCPKYATPRNAFFKALSDIGVNTMNEQEMIDSLLFGYNFVHNPDLILEPFKTFLSVTNRIK